MKFGDLHQIADARGRVRILGRRGASYFLIPMCRLDSKARGFLSAAGIASPLRTPKTAAQDLNPVVLAELLVGTCYGRRKRPGGKQEKTGRGRHYTLLNRDTHTNHGFSCKLASSDAPASWCLVGGFSHVEEQSDGHGGGEQAGFGAIGASAPHGPQIGQCSAQPVRSIVNPLRFAPSIGQRPVPAEMQADGRPEIAAAKERIAQDHAQPHRIDDPQPGPRSDY